jgi:NDP-sugar pyrophosphorylase family protein
VTERPPSATTDPILADVPVAILAGGLGTRLRAAVPDRPKALAPVGDRAFLDIQLELLRAQGVRHVVLCLGWEATRIQERLGDGAALGLTIACSVETGTLLGTAGALKLAAPLLGRRALVLNGDTYFATDYAALVRRHLAAHLAHGALATLAVVPVSDRSRYGTVVLDAEQRRIVAFREKQADAVSTPGWVNAGAWVLETALLDRIPAGVPASIERETFPQALAAGQVLAAAPIAGEFFDIGTPEGLAAFARHYVA